MIANPIAVAIAIFWNSEIRGHHVFTKHWTIKNKSWYEKNSYFLLYTKLVKHAIFFL